MSESLEFQPDLTAQPFSEAGGLTLRSRFLGGLWGAVVADALGVPVEFRTRASLDADPVVDLRAFGTYQQPRGTWSDDSSLLLCTLDAYLQPTFTLSQVAARFVRYLDEAFMTPHGRVFDIGFTTRDAIERLRSGCAPELAGGHAEQDNGNGSLMRILPVALATPYVADDVLADAAQRCSRLTHGHARSQLACGYYCLLARGLLLGLPFQDAYHRASETALHLYAGPEWASELPVYARVLSGSLAHLPRTDIKSTGYVVHTLEAAIWCVLSTASYRDAVLQAVNLGGDTDTVACIAGGLAGLLYGVDAVPLDWREALARAPELVDWFARFADRCLPPR